MSRVADSCSWVAATCVAKITVTVRSHRARLIGARSERLVVDRSRFTAMTHVERRIVVRVVPVVRVMPTGLVDIIVIGIEKTWGMVTACKRVVWRHGPDESWHGTSVAETESGGCAIHASTGAVVKPDASKVDRHIDFVAGVCIIAV